MSKRNKLLIGTISILVVCIIVTGFTYAYWRLTYQATSVNKIASSCFSMELKNEKNNITLESAYPISDEKGKSLTPYSFTITNTCNLFASYTINLEMLEGTTLSSKYVKTMINNEAITNLNTLETTDTSIEGATESRVLFKGSLGSGDSTDYTLRIWMDSETPFNEDSMNKVFQSKITVTAEVSTYSPVENGFTNLAEALLVNEEKTEDECNESSIDNPIKVGKRGQALKKFTFAKNRISSKQNVDLSKTAPLIMWQENHSTTMTTYSFTRVDSSAVGTNGIEESYTQILFGTSYEYDKETGMYNIFNRIATNPADLDFQDNIYYSCGASMGTTPESELVIWNSKSCANMIVITGYDGVADSTLTFENGNTIPTKIYTYNAYIYV